MNRLVTVVLFALVGCNAGPTPYVEPASAGITSASTSSGGPYDCVSTCVRVTEQLERDFAVLPSSIDCPRQFGDPQLNTCAKCSDRFSELFGVSLTCR
ncbi:MAG: hypothetical protein U0228_33075 [Myxococcaceae bacterium]